MIAIASSLHWKALFGPLFVKSSCTLYIQFSKRYDSYLNDSLRIESRNFYNFLFDGHCLKNWIEEVVFVMTLDLSKHKHCIFEALNQFWNSAAERLPL